ncbi:Suppressor of Profilin deletion [Malassezia equina]|uniref:Suppressor of Profilin deletion n=1 Tax=Malassezia equina TaxID=1381935 RepID=A0AAF0EFC3_9BASI|nr:Suppressor of Profilin deletion [Malassezia equina]
MRYARVFNDQLAEYLTARCEAEEAYVKHLQKATRRTIDTNYVPEQFQPVYDRLLSEVTDILHIHTTLAHQLQRDVEALQQLHTQGEWANLARHEEALAPILKDVQSLESQRAKSQRKLDKKGNASTQQKLLSTEDALQQARQAWRHRAPTMIQAYESADGQRLFSVRNVIKNFCKAQGDAAKALFDTARTTFQAVHHFDPIADMEQFAGLDSAHEAPTRFAVPLPSAAMHTPDASRTPSRMEEVPQALSSDPMEAPPAPRPSDEAPPAPLRDMDRPVSPLHRASMLPTPTLHRESMATPRVRPVSSLPMGAPAPRAPTAMSMQSSLSHTSRASSTSAEDRETLQRVRDQLRQSGAEIDGHTSQPRRREVRASVAQSVDRRLSYMNLSPMAPPSQWGSPAIDRMREEPTESSRVADTPTFTPASVPWHAHICERVNALWKGHELTKVMVVGEVRIALDSSCAPCGMAPLQLGGTQSLAQVRTRPGVCAMTSEPGMYELDLGALARAGDSATVLEYEVHVPSDLRAQYVPMLLDALWRCEPQQSSVLCTHRTNPSFASSVHMEGVSFHVRIPRETPVTGHVLSEPTADWDPDTQELVWHTQADDTSGRLAARFPLATQGAPQPITACWTVQNCLLSQVEVLGQPTAPTRTLVAGKYFVQP